jgi:glycosyltransferase involved in cell wall biosynthesis
LDEVLPVTMLEAMAHAKAIIATRAGSVAEAIKPGHNGLLVDYGDVAALAAAIGELCGNAGKRDALGQAAYATFRERYTLPAFGAAFVATMEEAIRRQSSESSSSPVAQSPAA